MDGHKAVEYDIKEAVTSLEYRLIDALSTIDTIRAKMKALKERIEEGRCVTSSGDREARIEAPKTPIIKGAHGAQELENSLWHLEN